MPKRKREEKVMYVIEEAKTNEVREVVLWEIIDSLQTAVKDDLDTPSLWQHMSDIVHHVLKTHDPVFCARNEYGQFAGFLCGKLWKDDHCADICYVEIHPNNRKRGVGSRLVQHFEKWCQLQQRRDQVLIYMDVVPLDTAMDFWAKMGYKKRSSGIWRKFTCNHDRYERLMKRQKTE